MIKGDKVIFAGIILLVTCACISCKGRTMSNMEPTGDTIEVRVAPLPDTTAVEPTDVIGSSETEL